MSQPNSKSKTKRPSPPAAPQKQKPRAKRPATARPTKLLSGGNPQIPKGYGDAPVQAYIAAMPGWKSEIGRRLDALIERAVPNLKKAVKWNSPLYGIADPDAEQGGTSQPQGGTPGRKGGTSQRYSAGRACASDGWFLGIHVFNKYVKVAFFRGAHLKPLPPGESKQKDVRYLDIHEHDQLDEAQFTSWVKQASQLPGERM